MPAAGVSPAEVEVFRVLLEHQAAADRGEVRAPTLENWQIALAVGRVLGDEVEGASRANVARLTKKLAEKGVVHTGRTSPRLYRVADVPDAGYLGVLAGAAADFGVPLPLSVSGDGGLGGETRRG